MKKTSIKFHLATMILFLSVVCNAQTWVGSTLVFNDPTFGDNSDYTAIYRTDAIGDRTRIRIRMGDESSSDLEVGYHLWQDGNWYTTFSIDGNGNTYSRGNVGIGTTTLTERLNVNGKILAEEVKVVVDVPADYVFEDAYELLSLEDVERYVEEKKHLPGVPAASELKQNGWLLGEMSNKMLEKIEELTLYIIQQQKKIAQLEAEIKEVRLQLNSK